MPRFRLTITYDYDANPRDYFGEAMPEEITEDVINRMIARDVPNVLEIMGTALHSGSIRAAIECLQNDDGHTSGEVVPSASDGE